MRRWQYGANHSSGSQLLRPAGYYTSEGRIHVPI